MISKIEFKWRGKIAKHERESEGNTRKPRGNVVPSDVSNVEVLLLVSAPAGEREFKESLDDVVVPKKNRKEKEKIAER